MMSRKRRFRRLIRRSVGLKFAFANGLAAAMIFAIALLLIRHSIQEQDGIQAESIARASADHLSGAVQRVFEDAFVIVENTHDDLISMHGVGVQDPLVYDTLLQRMLDGGDRFGAWLEWDAKEVPGGSAFALRVDDHGRFATYIHQNGMEMLREVIPAEVYASNLYRIPREEHRAYLLAPHEIDAQNGDPTLVTSLARPVQRDGHVVGVLAVDVKLDTIGQAIAALKMPKGTSLVVVSENGIVAAATNPSWIGRPLTSSSHGFERMLDRAKAGDGSEILPGAELPLLASWKAIRFAEVKNPWFVLMKMPQVSLLASGWQDRLQVFTIATIAIFAVLIVVLTTMHHLVAIPLRRVGLMISDLGQGLFGMTIPYQDRDDEIGDVARAVVRLQDSALEIARLHEESGEREYQRVIAREADLEGIAARFTCSIETVADSLRGVSARVNGRSQTLTGSVQNAAVALTSLSTASFTTRRNMIEAANATSALFKSIDNVGAQTKLCSEAASSVERNAASTNVSLADLKKSVVNIGALVELIGSIAEQINLISLNATIEAARAGQAGRGFAAVAYEIKALAGRTSAAADAVTAHIQALVKSSAGTHNSVSEMEVAFNGMKSISSTIASELDAQLSATGLINGLVEQALRSAEDTAATVDDLTRVTHDVTGGTAELHEQSHTLNQEVFALNEQVAYFMDFLRVA